MHIDNMDTQPITYDLKEMILIFFYDIVFVNPPKLMGYDIFRDKVISNNRDEKLDALRSKLALLSTTSIHR